MAVAKNQNQLLFDDWFESGKATVVAIEISAYL